MLIYVCLLYVHTRFARVCVCVDDSNVTGNVYTSGFGWMFFKNMWKRSRECFGLDKSYRGRDQSYYYSPRCWSMCLFNDMYEPIFIFNSADWEINTLTVNYYHLSIMLVISRICVVVVCLHVCSPCC